MKHEDYQEMLALHALGALDQSDARLVQEHLVTCADCRTELDEWRGTAGALTFDAEPMEPSPQVRDRILERVRAENSAIADTASIVELRTAARPAPRTWIPRFAAVAASVMLVALMIGIVILWQQNRAARIELARLSAEIDQAQKDRQRDQKLLGLINLPGARVVELTGTQQAPAAHALLAYDPKTGRAILRTSGLPQAAAGKAYQLWFIVGSSPVPGRTFRIEATGEGTSSDQVPVQAAQTAIFAITEESETGATAPTGPILLRST